MVSKELKQYDHIVFDFDGTLWNCEEAYSLSLIKALNVFGHSLSLENSSIVIGVPVESNIKAMIGFDEQVDAIAQEFRSFFSESDLKSSFFYDGVAESLALLKDQGYKLSIASFKRDTLLNKIVEINNLNYLFDNIAGSFSQTKRKKSDIIKSCLSKGEKVVYVGDTFSDYSASMTLGIDFVHAEYGFESVERNQNVRNSFYSMRRISDIFSFV